MQKRIKENVALLLRIEPECPLGLGSLKSTERAKKLVHDIGLIQRWLEKGASRDSNPGPCPWAARGDDTWEYAFSLLVAQKAPVRAGYTVLLCKLARPKCVGNLRTSSPARWSGFLSKSPSDFRFSAALWLVACVLVAAYLHCAAMAAPAAGLQASPGMSVRLDAAAEAGASLRRLHSLLVSWRGELVLERYYNGARADRLANMKSVSKSVISALVGIAIERGLIESVRQPVGSFFSDLLTDEATSVKRAITIEDLLTMRSGLESTSNANYGAWVQSSNWVRYILGRRLVFPPGTVMVYSTGNTHLLSSILTQATAMETWQFAEEALAKPLGFRMAQWPRDPQGIYFGGNDMLMTPRQMLAFGELYLQGGRAGGRQIVPAAWVRESLVARTASRRENGRFYGYGWWIREFAGRQTFYAWGYGGQYIFLVPSLDLVVVTTSSSSVSEERRGHRSSIFDIVEELIIKPVAAHPH